VTAVLGAAGAACHSAASDASRVLDDAAVTTAAAAVLHPSATVEAWAKWPMPNSPIPGLPNPQNYDLHTAGVVVDRTTGLMWQRISPNQFFTFVQAQRQCDKLSLAGYDDWRLPSRIELVSILDTRRTQPSIDVDVFPETASDWFWTSSLSADNPRAVWYVYFYLGYPKTDDITNQFSVRCVRETASRRPPAIHYDIEADTVRDRATGLTWQRAVPADAFAYGGAAAYCGQLPLAGRTWRVPSVQELLTLIDERSPAAPMIDAKAFPKTPSEPFWTSSAFSGDPGMAWQVYFDHGWVLYNLPNTPFRVRCVS
jgi:Protein of unknown function (DUF1566)